MDPPHTDVQMKENQLESIHNTSVRTQDVAWKTTRKRWMIETNGVGELGKFVQVGRHDNDDDMYANVLRGFGIK